MPSIDSLPPDQRAVLELVLRRGRTYDEIAQLLSIDRAGVRQRALAALDALGPEANVPPERRALITDYLLGSLPRRVTEQVRDRLAQSPAERAWARVIAAELEPISAGPLPEIPADAGAARPAPAAPAAPRPEAERLARPEARPRERRPVEEPEAAAEPETARRRRPSRRERRADGRRGLLGPGTRLEPGRERPPSRRGGKLVLLAAAVIILVIVLSIALGGGGGKSGNTPAASKGSTIPTTASTTPATSSTPTTSTPSTGTTTTGGQSAKIVAQVNLNSPTGGPEKGVAEILKAGTTQAVAIIATHVTPNKAHDAYAVWVYNSATDAVRLGFVSPGVSSSGKLQTEGPLPANASHFKHLIVTLETQANPKTPGTIVLEGDLTGVK